MSHYHQQKEKSPNVKSPQRIPSVSSLEETRPRFPAPYPKSKRNPAANKNAWMRGTRADTTERERNPDAFGRGGVDATA